MAITNGYATYEQFQEWSKTTVLSNVPVAERAIEAASRWIDEYCARHFWQATEARTFEARSLWHLDLGAHNDLVSVTTLETDTGGDGTFDATWDAADWELLPHNPPDGRPYTAVAAVGDRSFPVRYCRGRRARVQITGVWGWSAVPTAVTQACLIQASKVYGRRNSPEGVAGFGEFGPIRVSARLDPEVEHLLGPYRHPAVAVLVA